MQVDFYQLSGTSVERVLVRLAERILAGGGRLLVVTADATQAEQLDRALWSYSPTSFLPHGRAGQGGEMSQPVLIATDVAAANDARSIALADGCWRDEALGFDRVFHLFDDAATADARIAWKSLAQREGAVRNFWKQDAAGRWTKAA